MAPLPPAPGDFAKWWHYERRRRMGRHLSLADLHPEHVSANAVADMGEATSPGGGLPAGPGFMLQIGFAGVQDVNEVCSLWEYFNQDPFTATIYPPQDSGGKADAIFTNQMYLDAIYHPIVNAGGFVASEFFGIGIGSPWTFTQGSPGTVEGDGAVHVSLRLLPLTRTYQLVVINRWATPGNRRFVKTLGTAAQLGVINTLNAVRMELEYEPGRSVTGYVDGKKIGTFTDAADAGVNTPLGDIFANGSVTGSTIKGCGVFLSNGGGGINGRFTKVRVQEFYREMFGGY